MNSLNPVERPRTNVFDLSHEVKTTVDMGWIYPMLLLEALPGDKFLIKPELMARFIPMLAPVMHRIRVIQDFFFVPNRIMWDGWEKWITNQLEAEPPYLNLTGASWTQITRLNTLHYLGIPKGLTRTQANAYKLSAFPVAAYERIWNEYYRDQNLQTESIWATTSLNNGANTYDFAESAPYMRAWEHDYFTSGLPWAQKGDPVMIPLFEGDRADVMYDNSKQLELIVKSTGIPLTGSNYLQHSGSNLISISGGSPNLGIDPNGTLYLDGGQAALINELRAAFALQSFLEKNARGGTRYIEWVQAHFTTSSSDGRLQRPEFIGRQQQNIVISEVLSTAETTDVVGALAGHGITFSNGGTISKFCEEHGYIMSIINIQPVTSYSQGIHRLWRRTDNLDYAVPVFAHLGEQELKNWEIYADNTDGQSGATFAYIPRYQEYRTAYDRFNGAMADDYLYWHLGRQFGLTRPLLNETFITADVSKRIFAVTTPASMDTIQMSLYYDIKKISKLPKYAIPALT